MASIDEHLTESGAANLAALLLGGPLISDGRDPGLDYLSNRSPGLLRRLVSAFPMDPVGPAQTLNPVGAFSLTVPDFASAAVVSVEGGQIRVRTDGTLPSTTVGKLISAGGVVLVTGQSSLRAFNGIQVVASAATVNVDYYL